MSRYFR